MLGIGMLALLAAARPGAAAVEAVVLQLEEARCVS
jgi:hypothetical protein